MAEKLGSKIERRELGPKARRFLQVGTFLTGMLSSLHAAEAQTPSMSPNNDWAQLMGENVDERREEIDRLEAECSSLRARVARLEMRLNGDQTPFMREAGLKFEVQGEYGDAKAELARKEEAIQHLRAGMEKGVAAENKRREAWGNAVEGTIFNKLSPRLDLSPSSLGSPKIADYYAENQIGFNPDDHGLYFGDAQGKRKMLVIGADMTDADFYFTNGGEDLLIVFTDTKAEHMSLKFDDGRLDGYYKSDDQGHPIFESLE